MTIVVPPGFYEFIQWITEEANRRPQAARPAAPVASDPNIERLLHKLIDVGGSQVAKKAKRKVSSYNRKYSAAFKKCKRKHMKKNGTWKKGGFKRCVKEAHRMVKK
jgi:hypothetical protein